jgi:hypothetical protein
MPGPPQIAAVLGDIVSSRKHPQRSQLQRKITAALKRANQLLPSAQPLTATVGDEFQGIYGEISTALDATLLMRLFLAGEADVRFGVGWGKLTTRKAERAPYEQDGPAWWAAREAIDVATRLMSRKGAPKGLRTVFIDAGPEKERQASLNAYLSCRDEIVGNLDPRGARLLVGRLIDEPVTATARRERITVSGANQKNRRDGAYAVELSMRFLRGEEIS